MGRITDSLNKIDNSKQNTDELYKVFHSIDERSIPIIRFFLGKDEFVLRQRINEKNKQFESVSDLTYPPYTMCRSYGRANTPYNSMFYCCWETPKPAALYPRILALLETSTLLKDNVSKGIERSTLSKWIIKKPLELLMMPFSEYQRPNPMIAKIQETWDKGVKSEKVNEEGLELMNYMSKELCREAPDNLSYFKIANFIYYLLFINEKTKNVDGIIYPSVPAAGEGFNIVLKPTNVEEKLQFDMASQMFLYKDGNDSYFKIMNRSIGKDANGKLIFNPMPVDKDENEKMRKYEGLSFVN